MTEREKAYKALSDLGVALADAGHKWTKAQREAIMKRWDSWRAYIAEGGTASWPRDSFESLLDAYDEIIADLRSNVN